MNSCSPISAFDRPRATAAQHLALAIGERVEPGMRRGARGRRLLHELLDQPARHFRREQRLAVGDDTHGREQVVGQRVLEQEAARAGAQRLEDVLVEIERREDQHRASLRSRRPR